MSPTATAIRACTNTRRTAGCCCRGAAPGTDPGEFNIAHNITCDADGWVYVADRENHRVQVFDGNGKYETQWNNLHRPCGLFMPPGKCPICYIGELGAGAAGQPQRAESRAAGDHRRQHRQAHRAAGRDGPGHGPDRVHGAARADAWIRTATSMSARCRGPTGRRPGPTSRGPTICGRCTSSGRCDATACIVRCSRSLPSSRSAQEEWPP